MSQVDTIYMNINPDQEATEMESICMACYELSGESVLGKTRLLMTKIPAFKEIILVSFYCEKCGFKNNEVQFGGQIADYGIKIQLKIDEKEDLQREVIKSQYSNLKFSGIDLEIPTNKKGQINTIEGYLMNTIEDLESDQEERKKLFPEDAAKIGHFINILKDVIEEGKHLPITLTVDDPSGNSYIKNPYAPHEDKKVKQFKYVRTAQQVENMGFSIENAQQIYAEQLEQFKIDHPEDHKMYLQSIKEHSEQEEAEEQKIEDKLKKAEHITADNMDFTKGLNVVNTREESLVFKNTCDHCFYEDGENKMCTINIPYFKELIVMAFSCERCGYKSSETKPGGALSEKGIRITLKVDCVDDIKRDLYKSDSARLIFPEIELEQGYGTLGGVYSTVEGLINQAAENMEKQNPYHGDSDMDHQQIYKSVLSKLREYQEGNTPFTMVIEDLFENSFVQRFSEDDEKVKIEYFDRTYEQNEEWGLNDMKV